MSVQKLIADADKLLEKGKIPEALDKLKSAFSAEPTNQLVATKLANVFVDKGDRVSAAKVYIGLASRLSDAGKSQVAIAIYKQAMELTPGDYELKFRFAKECEGAGKLGDAHIYGQQVLQYYLQRKKYFDAANLMPILVRVHAKDETYKLAWVEIMQFSQAEQKLPHLLVALCGPPGLTSQEFSVGGEPTAMSEVLYESVKRLVDWFPRDPKIAYSVAWCAYKRGKTADFHRYLAECLRRDSDFCLGLLLFARWLAEQQKLNEALFVYKMVKDKVSTDKSVDMLTLHRMIESFVEKNGWIAFTEGTGEVMESKDFLAAFSAAKEHETKVESSQSEDPKPAQETPQPEPGEEVDLPAEIELSLGEGESSSDAPVEIQFTGGETRLIKNAAPLPAGQEAVSSPKLDLEPEPESPTAPPPDVEAASEDSVEFTSIIKREDMSAGVERKVQESLQEPEPSAPPPTKPTFNPLEAANQEEVAAAAEPRQEKTEIFSPLEVLQATNVVSQPIQDPPTKADIPTPQTSEAAPVPSEPTVIEGERTQMFSPVEAVEAGVASRRPFEKSPESHETLSTSGDATVVQELSSTPIAEQSDPIPQDPAPQDPEPEAVKLPGFMPIPEMAAAPGAQEEKVDMGEDLLEGPTRMLVAPPPADSTTNLIREVSEESAAKKGVFDVSSLLKKAERYIAKRNYYLARKALRHAQALGAEEEMIKEKLREIRKLELPDSLYSAVSTDEGGKEKSDQILEKLEREFDLSDEPNESESQEFSAMFDQRIEEILDEADPKTVLDFGVALHEMGLFRNAEKLLIALVERHPDSAFDAYYLAAISKSARKDYAGAASILKRLSTDAGRSEKQKISVYYALGELFERMKQRERSKSFFKKVAEIDSNYRNIREKLDD